MKIILTLLVFSSFAFGSEMQDSSITQGKEKEKQQVKEENQQKDKNIDRIRERNRIHNPEQLPDRDGNKRGKDVFIDKDGDGIADTRAGGMSLNKIRKRNRSGNSGSGGHGGGGYRGGN